MGDCNQVNTDASNNVRLFSWQNEIYLINVLLVLFNFVSSGLVLSVRHVLLSPMSLICHLCFVKIRTPLWASCQIHKIAGAHAPGMPGTFSPPPQVSDPDMHHGTCVTHVPWCMPGSLTSSFLWNRRRGKTFPAFPALAQPAILRIWQEAHSSDLEPITPPGFLAPILILLMAFY